MKSLILQTSKNHRLQKIIFTLALFASIVLFVPTRVTFAQSCEGVDYNDPSIIHIICPFVGAINFLIYASGAVFVGMVLIGAYKFATAQGDPKAAMGAKSTLTYAVAGLAAVIGVFVIIRIAGGLFGVNPDLTNAGVFDLIQDTICDFLLTPDDNGKSILTNKAGETFLQGC